MGIALARITANAICKESMKPEQKDARARATLPLASEELDVERKKVDIGSVRVRKTSAERVEHVRESTTREEVVVDRISINRIVETPTGIREEGDVTVIPVFEEIVTVERKWLLKEELRIAKRRTQVPHEEDVVLRQESAVVDRLPAHEKK